MCASSEAPSEAALIDNVDSNYLLFERARELTARGLTSRVVVPILRPASNDRPADVSLGIVELMCRISGLQRCDTFDAPREEPISLNLARHVAAELEARGFRSILLVTPGLRSQRSFEVYISVLGPRGIAVHCQPVFGAQDPSKWFDSAHGVQDVVLQFLKLWYYRILVLR